MGKTLYLECLAGISGDMTVAALLDLGASEDRLREALAGIPDDGFSVAVGRVKKAGIDCCDFRVILDAAHENHDHDMAYLHGGAAPAGEHSDAVAAHGHPHGSDREDGNAHAQVHTHPHAHRGMAEIRAILTGCHMTERAAKTALRIFSILAQAEAEAHHVPVEEVHFHEVGAIDSIVDIVAAAVCLDDLDITEVIVPKLYEGGGTVRCQHGILPVPVPAVSRILSSHQIPLELTGVDGEFVTPTGAAIVAAVMTTQRLPKTFVIKRTGLGAGKREYARPSILRAMLIEEAERRPDGTGDSIYKLETNIDDSTGEELGYVMERLLEAGARDVHYIPVYMKKNRPGWQLNVICAQGDIPALERIIFAETTTIGIRRIGMERSILVRRQMTLETAYGKANIKICETPEGLRYYPEYESVAAICREHGIPYREAYRRLAAQAEREDNR